MVISQEHVSCAELLKRFPQLFTDSIGDLDRKFNAIHPPDTATSTSAVFLSNPKAFASGMKSSAKVFVVGRKFKSDAEKQADGRTILISPNSELAMATVIQEYFLKSPYTNRAIEGVHPSATVATDAVLGQGVRIGPHAYVGPRVKLGAGVYIGANAVVEEDSSIGDQTVIHPLAYIGHSTEIGKRCEIMPNAVIGKEGFGYAHDEKGNHYRIPHQGRVVIEDNVHIGATCTIDRATFLETRIQSGTIFDNRVHIGHNSSVGRNSIVTAGLLVAGSTKIGANFLAGGGSVISGHLEVCDNVQISGLSAVGKSVTKPGAYGGNPLQPLQAHLKTRSSLAHVYEMRKQISMILKHLGIKSEEKPSED